MQLWTLTGKVVKFALRDMLVENAKLTEKFCFPCALCGYEIRVIRANQWLKSAKNAGNF